MSNIVFSKINIHSYYFGESIHFIYMFLLHIDILKVIKEVRGYILILATEYSITRKTDFLLAFKTGILFPNTI